MKTNPTGAAIWAKGFGGNDSEGYMVMAPEPGNPIEAEGVLNPSAFRGPDWELHLFPRSVAKGNYSRIGIVRIQFNKKNDPKSV